MVLTVYSHFIQCHKIGKFLYILMVLFKNVQQHTQLFRNTLTLSAPLANGSVMNVIKMASNTVASTVTDADTLNAQPR